MKQLAIIFLAFLMLNCSNDDNDSEQPTSPTIAGTWQLVKVTGGFIGLDQDIEKGVINWRFDTTKKEVTIENNAVTTGGGYTGLPSGTYSYSITAPADQDILYINENSVGVIDLQGAILNLKGEFEDGYNLTLHKN